MKRIIVVCEGQTEQEFCKDVLLPFFLEKKILIEYPTIKKSGGGIVAWEEIKKQIVNHLKQDRNAIVTTLIDYYGLKERHQFPNWAEAETKIDKNKRLDVIEKAMHNSIDDSLRYRFVPYIQLHEFEGLLFNNIDVFDNNFEKKEFTNYNELVNTITNNPNPELINDGNDSAPSKRLIRLIKGYNKIIYGSSLAHSIGIQKMRQKCPRFNGWITNLESI